MNNRMGMALALGGGYVLGRTKKARLALGVGSLVLGRRLNVSPKALGEFAAARLRDNPQLGELGAELRQQLGGVGKAATGALATRQLGGLADRLHAKTLDLRDRVPGAPGGSRDADAEDAEDADDGEQDAPARRRPAAKKAAKKAPARAARKTAENTAAKAPAARRSAARKEPAAKKTAGARKQSGERASSARPARRTRAQGGGRG